MASFFERVGRYFDDVLPLSEDLRARLENAQESLAGEHWEDALVKFQALLEERPALVAAASGLASALHNTHRDEEAHRVLTDARREFPHDANLALQQAELALISGDIVLGSEAARAALRNAPAAAVTTFLRASVLLAEAESALGRPDRAAWALAHAQRHAPQNRSLARERAAALSQAGDVEQLRWWLAQLSELTLEDRVGYAKLAIDIGELELAATLLDEDAQLSEGDPAARVPMAELALRQGDLQKAREHAEASVKATQPRESMAAAPGQDLEEVVEHSVSALRDLDLLGAAWTCLAKVAALESRQEAEWEAWLNAGTLTLRAGLASDDKLRMAVRRVPLRDAGLLARCVDRLASERERVGEAKVLDELYQLAKVLLAQAGCFAWLLEHGGHAGKQLSEDCMGDRNLRVGQLRSDEPRFHIARAVESLVEHAFEAAKSAHADWISATLHTWQSPEADAALMDRIQQQAWLGRWRDPAGGFALHKVTADLATEPFLRKQEQFQELVERTTDLLDHPLALAVMGEFNAGKSTFINAVLGRSEVKTGVVPTTAELERVPVELAGGIWLLDTPGTNAPAKAHAERAEEALMVADAVLWLMDATQAGKATESEFLKRIRSFGRPVIPVLNKVDRLSTEELERVAGLLEQPPLAFERVFRISARKALEGRLRKSSSEYQQSGVPGLLKDVEALVLKQAPALKRQRNEQALLRLVTMGRDQLRSQQNPSGLLGQEQIARFGRKLGNALLLEAKAARPGWHRCYERWLEAFAAELIWLQETGLADASGELELSRHSHLIRTLEHQLVGLLEEQAKELTERWATIAEEARPPRPAGEFGERRDTVDQLWGEPRARFVAEAWRQLMPPVHRCLGYEIGLWQGGVLREVSSSAATRRLRRSDGDERVLVDILKQARRDASRTGMTQAGGKSSWAADALDQLAWGTEQVAKKLAEAAAERMLGVERREEQARFIRARTTGVLLAAAEASLEPFATL